MLTKIEIEQIKSSVPIFKLPKGSILYRTQPEKTKDGEAITIDNDQNKIKAMYDSDTGKTGIYFATSPHIPIGMVLEYDNELVLYKFITTKDLDLYTGKYSYRDLQPELFYESLEDKKTRKYKKVDIKKLQNWNHFESEAFPIHEKHFSVKNVEFLQQIRINGEPMGEVFINDENAIEFVENMGIIDTKNAEEYINCEIEKVKNKGNKDIACLVKIKEKEQDAGASIFKYIKNPITGKKVKTKGKLGIKIVRSNLEQINHKELL